MSEPHACRRAKERYGLELTVLDLREIARRCRKGEGLTERNPDGTQFHGIVYRDRVLMVVYLPPGPACDYELGVVKTIMPPEVASIAAKYAERHAMRRRGDFRPRTRGR